METKDKIIVALDVDSLQHVGAITHQLKGLISHYKVGWRLFMAEGTNAVRWLSNNHKYDVFLDLKIDDIASTVQAGVSNLPTLPNLKFLSFQGGKETLQGLQKADNICVGAEHHRLNDQKFLYVPELSTRRLPNVPTTFEDWHLKRMVSNVMSANCDGIVTSGQRIKMFRKKFPDTLIVSPGIRLEASEISKDHLCSCTPKEAFDMGANYIVVGRPIIEAKDPKQAVLDIIEQVDS